MSEYTPPSSDVQVTPLESPSTIALPTCNTGVQTAFIDWLGVTFKAPLSIEDIFFGFADKLEFVQVDYGRYGYRAQLRCGGIVYYYGGPPELGVHVQISGSGCRELEAAGLTDWQGWLAYLESIGGSVSRCDVALDDRAGFLDMDTIGAALDAKEVTSRWRVGNEHKSIWGNGRTFYLGSSKSDARLRIYDKAAERGVEGHWIRVELQLRDERARGFVSQIVEAGAVFGRIAAGVIRGYVEFKRPSGDETKSRWPIADWWAAFLESVEKVRITLEPRTRTLEDVKRWIQHQVGPWLAVCVETSGGDLGEVIAWMKSGKGRWKSYHYEAIGKAA